MRCSSMTVQHATHKKSIKRSCPAEFFVVWIYVTSIAIDGSSCTVKSINHGTEDVRYMYAPDHFTVP